MADLPRRQFFNDPILQPLIDSALENNLDLRVALQRVEIARATYLRTTSFLRPTGTAVLDPSYRRYSQTVNQNLDNLPSNPTTEFFLGLQSSWEIDIWQKLRNRRRAAFHRLLASERGVVLLRTILVAEVSSRYYRLMMLDSQLSIITRNIELQQSAVDVISIQKQGGRATKLAVQQFQAQLLETQSLEAQYRQRIIETENELNVLLGRFAGAPVARASFRGLDSPMLFLRTGLPATLLFRRPDVLEAELELSAFEYDIEAARAEFYPALSLNPYVGLNSFRAADLFDPASFVFGIVGGLTAPVFNRIAIRSNYDRSTAAARQAFSNYQKEIVEAYAEVATNVSRIYNYSRMHALQHDRAQTLKSAISTSKDLYLAGYANYLEIVLAQGNLLDAELQLVSTHNSIRQSYIDLYRSLGGGWQ